MMKKKKPLLILLGIIFIILVILFFVFSRKSPGATGEESALRRFFTFGTRTSQDETGNETGGDFLNGGINPLTGREYTDEELRLLRQEQDRLNREQETTFTGQQPINPFDPNRSLGGSGGTGGGGTGGGTGGGGTGGGTGNPFTGTGDFGNDDTTDNPQNPITPVIRPTRPSTLPQGPACSDIDLYITFTNEEKIQIEKLQQRFNAVAENIVSDEDVQIEENNYGTFKIRTERFEELNLMCEETIVKASSSPFSTLRVPTPFWKSPEAKLSFIAQNIQRTMRNVRRPGTEGDPACEGGVVLDPLVDRRCRIDTYVYTLPLVDNLFEKIDIDGAGTPFNWFEILYRIYIW